MMNDYKSDDQKLVLTIRQVSTVCALFLIVAFAAFIAGYFFGQKNAVNNFIENSARQAIADEIATSLEYDSFQNENKAADRYEEKLLKSEKQAQKSDSLPIADNTVLSPKEKDQPNAAAQENAVLNEPEPTEQNGHYYAPLIGYGTQKAAQKFITNWQEQGYTLLLKQHTSQNSKGKKGHWYQVITPSFDSIEKVALFIEPILKKENLKNIQIIKDQK